MILDLVEKKPDGVFSMLDEECFLPNGTDANLLQKLHNTFGNHSNYKKNTKAANSFGIVHFAGEITYSITGFMDKNRLHKIIQN